MNTLTSLSGHILEHAHSAPEKTAFIADNGSITYGQLAQCMYSVCAELRSLGIRPGDHIVSVAQHSTLYPCVCYGIHLFGAVHIPVENRIPSARLSEIASTVHAKLIISADDPCCGIPCMSAERLIGKVGAPAVPAAPPSDECAEIIYTTGTTGKSKGVMVSSGNLASYVTIVNPTFGMNSDTVFLICTPLNHAGGLRRMHMSMAAGCTAVLLDGVRDMKKFFRLINEHKVTATYLPPASIRMLLAFAAGELAKLDGQLDFIYTASAPFPSADIETLIGIMKKTRLFQGYGGSETGSVANYNYNAQGADITCLGHPYDGVSVKLIDDDGNTVSGAGNEGYICVKSPMNMSGYLNEPELTASIFSDGWIRTSDRGYFDSKGRLFFAGRSDDVINVGGFKVAPTEVESAALRCDVIRDCVCTAAQTRMGTALKLLVVIKDGVDFNPRDIAAALRPHLEAYKIPSIIEQIAEVPRTYNGKIDRKALK